MTINRPQDLQVWPEFCCSICEKANKTWGLDLLLSIYSPLWLQRAVYPCVENKATYSNAVCLSSAISGPFLTNSAGILRRLA